MIEESEFQLRQGLEFSAHLFLQHLIFAISSIKVAIVTILRFCLLYISQKCDCFWSKIFAKPSNYCLDDMLDQPISCGLQCVISPLGRQRLVCIL